MTIKRKTLITGASVADPTLAYWLSRLGMDVTELFARSLLLGCFVLLSTGSGASGNPPFANVTRLKGEVTATSPQGETRQLRAGAPVFVGEKLRASANGEAVL